jgi:hypothetical protein
VPICTYLDDYEVTRLDDTLEDKELKEILAEVNALPGEQWCIRTTKIEKLRWCRKPQVNVFYTLFVHFNITEWQVINFAPKSDSEFISTLVPKWDILNYLNGYLAGWHAARPKGA